MKVTLKAVRLSFPTLFTAKGFNGGEDNKKFGATFILNKEEHADLIKQVEQVIAKVKKEKWGKDASKVKKTCMTDGEEKEEFDGYDDTVMAISSSTSKRPPIVDRQLIPLAEEDDTIYAGCIVNATIDIWAQDNQFGKRVNAQLRAVQFWEDGEAFGADPVSAEDEFEAADDDDMGGLEG